MKNKYELEDATPKEMSCIALGCPSIYKAKNITPQEMNCLIGQCAGIYSTQESYLIIGKRVNPSDAGLEGKIGKDEVLIEVPRKLIDERRR